MDNDKNYLEDIKEIRSLMERSTRFISLSGLSGVMAGIYALIGSVVAYKIVYIGYGLFSYRKYFVSDNIIIVKLLLIAGAVLITALTTGFWLTQRKASKDRKKLWDPASKRLIINLLIPLMTGGIFIIILLLREEYAIIAPSCLLFYGLALINASKYTLDDIRFLGISEILTGLLCAIFPGFGLLFWAFGFGILHIVYGTIMHLKYS